MIGAESRILRKKRYSSYHVEVSLNKKISLKKKNVVIVDDIVSTGHTILEAAKLLRKLGAENIYCVCVHGLFVNDSFKKLQRNKIKIISTNTLPNEVARIDVSGVIADALRN
jgi:ribose-phosphate pyrophosphokinase